SQELAELDDVRLASGVADFRDAGSGGCREDGRLGAGDRCFVQIHRRRLQSPRGLQPASMYLDEASVTGTETAILAAAAAPGISEIRHAACEPHVVELCEFLRRIGVGVDGGG